MIPVDRNRMARRLKTLGFRKIYKDYDPLIYGKTVGDRDIEIQLWRDGGHRASHFLNGRMSTYPSPFGNVAEMERAIQIEMTRTDHPPPMDPTKPHMVIT